MAEPWKSYQEGRGANAAPWQQYARKPSERRKTGFIESLGTGLVEGVQNIENHIDTGLKSVGVDLDGVNAAMGLPTLSQRKAAQGEQRATAGDLGRIAGNIVGTLPAAAVRGGAAIQGAIQGATLSDSDNFLGVAKDAAIGAASGLVGDRVVRAVGAAVSPRVAPVIRRLQEQGIPVTPGQIARAAGTRVGNFVGATEDRLAGLPLIGDAITSARRRGIEGFNTAAVNRALAPIGAAIPPGVSGREAITLAGDTLSEAYDAVLPRVNVRVDSQLNNDLAAVRNLGSRMVGDRAAQLEGILQDDVIRHFNTSGQLDGAALKAIDTRLGESIRDYAGGATADERQLGRALVRTQRAIRGLAARQNSEVAGQIRAIDQGYANLVRVERAATGTRDGNFTPNQLRTAVRVTDRSTRKRAVARGDALMQDLADDASAVLPAQVPDSGTAGRGLLALGTTGGLGAVGGFPALAAAGAATLPYSRAGGRVVESLMTGRQGAGYAAARSYVDQLARPASIAGGAGVVAATNQGQ